MLDSDDFYWSNFKNPDWIKVLIFFNGYHCDLRKNTQFKIFLAESVSIQTKGASVNTIKDIIFLFLGSLRRVFFLKLD